MAVIKSAKPRVVKSKKVTVSQTKVTLGPPAYDPDTHVHHIASHSYYRNLLHIRDITKDACDRFMREQVGALNVDLFMLTTSVSSPMGPGSDSEPLPIQFGDHEAYLTDSSQFGFEPLIMNGIDSLYCYLPSMRGEDPDARHLNQFFHCEAEIAGNLPDIMDLVERFVRYLASSLVVRSLTYINQTSMNPIATKTALCDLVTSGPLKRITFDEACELLIRNGHANCINVTPHGRDINSRGEQLVCELLDSQLPLWITHFDRDRVPFYQKPDPLNDDKVLCADLIFPALVPGSFGGEIVGAGQRQDIAEEMQESLDRQGLSSDPYHWYIELRRRTMYKTTSGFGLGIERFLAWSLCLERIRDAIVYPREKNIRAKP